MASVLAPGPPAPARPTSAGVASVPVPGGSGPDGTRARAVGRAAGAGAAALGLAAALGGVGWLVLAAAERPSVLAPPSVRGGGAAWLLGPLAGALPHLATSPARLHADLLVALAVLAGAWLVAWVAAPALPVRVVGGAVALAHAAIFLGPPQPLTDLFNYLVYGRMAAHGINPYRVAPVAAPHGPAYALANWHHLPSPYGPLFTLLSEPLGLLPLHSAYWTWKGVVVVCALATLALVWWLAVELGRSPQRALACAGLCPVVLAVGTGGFHNDAPAVLAVVAAAACLVRSRRQGAGAGWDAGAGALAVAAAGIKPSFALVVGIVVLGARRRPAALAGAAWAGVAVALVVLIAFGGALPAVGVQGALVSPASVPNLLGVAAGHGGADPAVRAAAQHALLLAAAAATVLVAWRRDLALSAMGAILFCAVLALAWVMPWYLGWALPFLALGRPRALVPVAVVAAIWLGAGGLSQLPSILHAFGFAPTRSPTGLANHDLLVRLVR